MNRKRPFQHPAIYTLVARYWFSSQRAGLIESAKGRFLKMPDNLIAFACNAVSTKYLCIDVWVLTPQQIESALADIATGVHQFTNKVYAPK